MPISKKTVEKTPERDTIGETGPEFATRPEQELSTPQQLANALGKLPQYAKQKLLAAGGVSKDDVVWCYRNLLGREPESDRVVEAGTNTTDFKELVLGFLASQEFIAKHASVNLAGFGWGLGLPHVLDGLDIDIDATPAELGQCAAKIKGTWEHLGGEKAHFSVLTDDSFLPQNLHGSIDAFWTSGESEASRRFAPSTNLAQASLQKKCVSNMAAVWAG